MKTIRPVFKCHGGKFYLAKWVIDNFPDNYQDMTYIEPFIGGGNVLLNKEKSKIEVMNDLDASVVGVYQALRDEPKELIRRLNLTKYCQETFEKASKKTVFDDYLEKAKNEFILRRMSRGGLKAAFAWSNRLRGGVPGDVNAWNTAIKALPELAERIKEVHIFNKPALEVLKTFDGPETLAYCDPPYLHETRVSKAVYASEMTTEDHIQLSHILNAYQGKVLLSGYMSPLYARLYKNWNIEKKKIANHSSQKKTKEKKVEILWKNF
jgi:DNA adenine methylase